MRMDQYEPWFFNANFTEVAGAFCAYRGELVLQEGEVADAQGRRKPPHAVMKQSILLTEGDQLRLLSGSLDELQFMPALIEKYGPGIQTGAMVILFVVNIDQPFTVQINGVSIVCIPLVQGMIWNELSEMVALEKGDFKGQSSAEKVVTLFEALKTQRFKYPASTLEVELGRTNGMKRETHGAV